MKVLIVEDDLLQAERVSNLTSSYFSGECEIIGPQDDFGKALSAIQEHRPNIALIDIALYRDLYAGIHVAEFLEKFHRIPIVFLSALTDPAILARTEGIDFCEFLKKPFDAGSLSRALDKAKQLTSSARPSIHRVAHAPNNNDRFWAKIDRNEYEGVRLRNIIYFKALDHFNELHVKGLRHPLIVKGGLKKDIFDAHLSFYPEFYQLSRSLVINRDYIQSIKGNELLMNLEDERKNRLKIPRERKDQLFKWLNIVTE